jgi:two-component system LytT family sensor kinase
MGHPPYPTQSGLGPVAPPHRSAEILLMSESPERPFITWRRLILIFGVWTLVAVMSTQTSAFAITRMGRSFDWKPFFFSNMTSCMLWAAFTPFLLALGRRFRIERGVWPMHLLLHLAVGVAFTAMDCFSWTLEAPYIRPGMPPSTIPFLVEVARQLVLDLGWYFIIVALAHVEHYATLSRQESLRRAQLQSQLDAARLDALQSQLRPHFLFNTLTTIAEQVYGDPAGADTMITRLSRLLRSSFVDPEVQEVTLRQELELLQCYLDIARVRFHDRLTIDFDIHPNALDAFVPRFLLQPLAENALQHGIEPAEAGGRLELRVRAHQHTMTLELHDDGVGLPAGALRNGTGLRNTRQRLEHLYGDRAQLEIAARPTGGTVVRVTLPFRREPDPLASTDSDPRLVAVDAPTADTIGARA